MEKGRAGSSPRGGMIMANIPNAKVSPRIDTGVLYWYEGDTFSLVIELDLTDQDGESVIIGASDTVKIVFLNERRETVKEFSFTNVENNTVTMDFDSTVTALFPRGKYTYDVYYTAAERTTLANENEAVVE